MGRYLSPVLPFIVALAVGTSARAQARASSPSDPAATSETIRRLEAELRGQDERISRLEQIVAAQARLLARSEEVRALPQALPAQNPLTGAGEVPAAANGDGDGGGPAAGFAPQQKAEPQSSRIDTVERKTDRALAVLAGFRFSGDFRYRFDMQARSSNAAAGPLQNIRNRYRVRLNVDKDLDARLRFHLQLSTGPFNNYLTNDQDFTAMGAKHPFSVSEASIEFKPHRRLSLQIGRLEEIFADLVPFLWDADIRFTGFHQSWQVPLGSKLLGLTRVELRAAEYILSNPAVAVLSLSSSYVAAGFRPGQRIGAANLFHPGVVLAGNLGGPWKQQITADAQIYRNPNQIAFSFTEEGVPVLIGSGIGVALVRSTTGAGTATTTPEGAVYTAPGFQIPRLVYRLEHSGVRLAGHPMPLSFELQVSRNTAAKSLRDAVMGAINLGIIREPGDARFHYLYTIKDANALISQFTDDNLGTGSGVNVAVHGFRFDIGLRRSLQWQTRLYVQHQRRSSNPGEQFFVPLPRGTNATFRFQTQLAFTF